MCIVRHLLLVCAAVLTADMLGAEEIPGNSGKQELLISSVFADSSIVAPVVEWHGRRADGSSYRYGLSGWTIGGEAVTKSSSSRSLLVSADVTPIHANNSNRIFVNGRREPSLVFRDGSYRVRGGVRFSNGSQVTDVLAAVRYESVGDACSRSMASCTDTSSLATRWRRPYAGLDVTHTWVRRHGGAPLIGSVDGMEVTARGELYAGSRSWGRLTVTGNSGRDFSRWHVSHVASLLYGSRLDAVNRQLLGGSWDALGGTALYGFRYGEFRVRRAVSGSGGVDYKLPGTWRSGVRFSCTDNDVDRTCGGALNVSVIWHSVGLNGGIGVPAHRSGSASPRVAYLGAVIPLRQR